MSINLLSKLINNYFERNQTENIIWSDSTTEDLVFINSGVPNAAYYDTKLQGVVKFIKRQREIKSNLINNIKSKEDVINNVDEYNFIIEKIKKLENLDYIRKINTLETFCHIKGYVIYHNINNLTTYMVAISPLIEYLENYKDFNGFETNEDIINLDNTDILKVNDDIKIYDQNGNPELSKIIEVNETSIKIDKTYNNDDVFIYGSKVDDFHTLDKSYIYTLNVCATQELFKLIKKKNIIINYLKNIIIFL